MPDKLMHSLLWNTRHATRPQARHDCSRGEPGARHHAGPMLVNWRAGYAPWTCHGHLALTHCQHLLLLGCLLLLQRLKVFWSGFCSQLLVVSFS